MFPVPESNTIQLYQLVTKTLMHERPHGWQKYLDRFLKTDQILPESMANVKEASKSHVCLKILNFEAGQSNFILRPGQILDVEELADERLKTVYCNMKALKAHFKADVKSYFLKKVLLLPENLEMARDSTQNPEQLLFQFFSHPSLKKVFETHIDYDRWEELANYSDSYEYHFYVPSHSIGIISRVLFYLTNKKRMK